VKAFDRGLEDIGIVDQLGAFPASCLPRPREAIAPVQA
jgi:hypothetical protein